MISRINPGRRATLVMTLAALVTSLLVPATVAAGGGTFLPTNFYLTPGYSCISGQGAGEHELRVKLYSAAGTFKGGLKTETDVDGYWGPRCFFAGVNPGDRLWASDGSTTRNFTVPNLTLKTNRATDVVSGTAPANSSVFLVVENCQVDPMTCDGGESALFGTNGKGTFSRDFTSTYNIRGGDAVDLTWRSPQGDVAEILQYAPSISVQVGEIHTWGTANPGTQVTMWLFDKNGKQIAKYNTRSDQGDGEFGGHFKAGKDVEVGDFVGSDIASDALFQVIKSNPTFNTGADTIGAKCFANSAYVIYVNDESDEFSGTSFRGVASINGSVIVSTQDEGWNLVSGDQVSVICTLPTGDDQATNYEVP